MTKSTSLAFALILSLASVPATAQDEPTDEARPSAWQRFSERFDTNTDGVVTREEYQRGDKGFERFDRNDDDQLTEDDFAGVEGRFGRGHRGGAHRGAGHHGAGFIAGADADKSGSITSQEWQSFAAAIDDNGDGSLDEAELRAFHDLRRDGVEKRSGRERRGGSPLERLDADKSGALDASEQQSLFASMDANGDGTISAEEMPQRRRGRTRGAGGGGGGGPVLMLLKKADADQDGQLSSAEWQAFMSSADVDSDGSLSRDELAVFRPEGAPAPPADTPALTVSRLDRIFTLLDANSDGVIGADEWPKHRRRGGRGR